MIQGIEESGLAYLKYSTTIFEIFKDVSAEDTPSSSSFPSLSYGCGWFQWCVEEEMEMVGRDLKGFCNFGAYTIFVKVSLIQARCDIAFSHDSAHASNGS